MKFPLADWIDDHAACRFNLGPSGMHGTVRHPFPTAAEVRSASEPELRRELAAILGVHSTRVFLTHGATEANAWAILYLRRELRGRASRCRVQYPEYPPLFDLARWAGFRLTTRSGPTELAVLSQPRNPVGDLWDADRLAEWTREARATVVDETFREFTTAPSVQNFAVPGLWTTGSFTKAYGADDLRVGYIVPPEEEAQRYSRFHGLAADELPEYSVAGALAVLQERDRILMEVRAFLGRHRDLWSRATPGGPLLAAPVAFDQPVLPDGDTFARRCLRSSILVSPGSFFGDPTGVRVCLTRRSFPRDLAQYVRVRAAAREATGENFKESGRTPRVQRLLAARARVAGGRG